MQLQSLCTLQALADAGSSQIYLQNPLPGKRGTLGQNIITGIPDFRLDANISKTFKVKRKQEPSGSNRYQQRFEPSGLECADSRTYRDDGIWHDLE